MSSTKPLIKERAGCEDLVSVNVALSDRTIALKDQPGSDITISYLKVITDTGLWHKLGLYCR